MSNASDLEFLTRNAVEVIAKEELEARLGRKGLRVKAGFDPSAPDIHLGHTVLLRKLREFQDLGHKVIFIIGDYTAMVGDPTGQTKTRPMLTKEQVEKNARTYQKQAFKFLDKDPKKIEIVRNSEWLAGRDMFQIFFGKLGSLGTVDQLLQREDFDNRRKMHRPISLREFIYPLLQGYDSVKVEADIELGGTDQKFNLLVGRDIQVGFGQKPQVVMTLPLLVGLDGQQKMSKSYGNQIGVMDSAKDVFGKTMSIPDALMESWYDLLTQQRGSEVSMKVSSGLVHPRDAKIGLAKEIVGWLHDKKTAEREAAEFNRIFRDKKAPTESKELIFDRDPIGIVEVIKKGTLSSTSATIRLIQQGAVTVNNEKITDPKAEIVLPAFVKAGKKSFFKAVRKP